MRAALFASALLATACGQAGVPEGEPPEDAQAGASGAGRIAAEPFVLEAEALVGLWSFARDCGLYDLVFQADDSVEYYDYSADGSGVSYRGAWATADNNRVVLSMRQVDMNNALTGDALTYNLDVMSPVTDDLTAHFARTDGVGARDVTARRCTDMEDRD